MKPRYVIIGGGISGLSLGWFLKQRFGNEISLVILEKEQKCGGWIQTKEIEGFLFEQGPRSCRTKGNGRATLRLIEALNLEAEVITSPVASQRFLYCNGDLEPMPTGLYSFFRTSLKHNTLGAFWKEWKAPICVQADESIDSFFTRRMNQDIAETFIDPLVTGIYAGDMRKLSIRSCFPVLHQFEQKYGSILKGMLKKQSDALGESSPFVKKLGRFPIFSFRKGMQTLIKALSEKLAQEIQLGKKVSQLNIHNEEIEVKIENGSSVMADRVFLSAPAHVSSNLFQGIDHNLSTLMASISAVSVAVVGLGWKKDVLKREGFGYLVPSKEHQDILGVVWDSSAFPDQNTIPGETRLSVMLGGAYRPDILALPQWEIVNCALEAIKKHLSINVSPDVLHISIAKDAIPQYFVGHAEKVEKIERCIKKLSTSRIKLFGNSFHGISVNDCIAEAEKIAARL